ncbi:5'-3' exonuclease [Natronocella acetinitrilica]|uniref:5'-3' exonuclease n=1 Tax=Natronocella acetinitrilica TaxID=414046 RepID=A0AAE3G871_9GAMM|nr:5'-3' exonuclease H3TH domain-containing protein [Natronocella acetinitrilica]MCP1676808.1 5'-3' exonuclease [Natronocella acetinitrilica]
MQLYLIDASIYIFRAWFSLDDRVRDDHDNAAHAVFGYGNFLLDFLEGTRPGHALAGFDESLNTCFRNDFYPPYKANRPEAPEDLKRQIGICRDLTRGLGLLTLASDRYEADDLIGAAAERFRPAGFSMRFMTSDKDYAQLLEPGDRIWDAAGRRNLDCEGVEREMGVRSDQVADLLALAGDSVDNIPGVPGVGPKSARVLLQHFGGLEGIYESLDLVPQLPMRGAARVARLLDEHRDMAFLCRRLATIHRGAPLECTEDCIAVGPADPDLLGSLPLPGRVRRRVDARLEADRRESEPV